MESSIRSIEPGGSGSRNDPASVAGRDPVRRLSGKAKLVAAVLVMMAMILPSITIADPMSVTSSGTLDSRMIPKYVNQLTGPPPVYVSSTVYDEGGNVLANEYRVNVSAFEQQILPYPMPMTPVWGYGGEAKDAVTGASLGFVRNSPGPSFEATRGVPSIVEWINDLNSSSMFAVDPTLHWANPNQFSAPVPPVSAPTFPPGYAEAQSPVPIVPHLHGGEVQSTYDGNPNSWFTASGLHGPAYNTLRPTSANAAVFEYPNEQPATTLWYHDHALGITRLNVMSGLAGFYLLRDPNDSIASLLPSGVHEMPIAIQDRTFNTDGSFHFDSVGVNPDIHPYWTPEFFGNSIMVNGLVWPNMNVDQGVYRLRLLDGSNARFYTLTFLDKATNTRLPFVQIGTDGGYLRAPVVLTSLTMAPGERADILIDFSKLTPGSKILLSNSAKAPFPRGTAADPQTVGQIMQFTVADKKGMTTVSLPQILNPGLLTYPSLPAPTNSRVLTLTELEGDGGPLAVLLNGQMWDATVSERPTLGSTEEWVIVNPTMDAHPIHLHLVQFQLVSRQMIKDQKYFDDWLALNSGGLMDDELPFMDNWTVKELPVAKYLLGKPMASPLNEQGWKDTIKMYPGEVTVIRVRFAPIGGGDYPFDPTVGPGYVWHCHILDHEDNEMMRPYEVIAANAPEL